MNQVTLPMLWTIALFCLLCVSPCPAAEDAEETPEKETATSESPTAGLGIPWCGSFAEAKKEASRTGKPLMVDFGAEWCGFCKKLDRETFGDEKVILLLRESFVAVKVDTDKQPEIGREYKVEGLPTVVFLTPDGEEIRRIVGFRPPDVFLEEARKSVDSSKALAELEELAAKNPKDFDAQRSYARALLAAGKAAKALEVLETALKAVPPETKEQAALLLDLGDTARLSGQPAKASDAYRKVLKMDPDRAEDVRQEAFLPLARVLIAQREFPEAIGVLDQLLSKKPEEPQEHLLALYLRSYSHAVLRDAEKSVADLEAASEADPEGRWGLRASLIIEAVEAD